MTPVSFRRAHEASWRALEAAVKQKRQGFRNPEELTSFSTLYRKVTGDLAYAQTYFPGDTITQYLNALVGQAHHRLYRGGEQGFGAIWRFLGAGFPQTFRRASGYILLATLISLVGALFGYFTVYTSPLEAYHLLPAQLLSQFQPTQAGPHAVNAPVMASVIMTHNITVTIEAFVGGITLGLFTLWALWNNSVILGVLAALFHTAHRSVIFWSLIVPHGVTELLAIFIAGGAGLWFAHRLIAPAAHKRGTALRLALTSAAQLMLGVAPMLVIAGTIEGFLTPSALPVAVKFSVAILTACFWLIYFSCFGRTKAKINVFTG